MQSEDPPQKKIHIIFIFKNFKKYIYQTKTVADGSSRFVWACTVPHVVAVFAGVHRMLLSTISKGPSGKGSRKQLTVDLQLKMKLQSKGGYSVEDCGGIAV